MPAPLLAIHVLRDRAQPKGDRAAEILTLALLASAFASAVAAACLGR